MRGGRTEGSSRGRWIASLVVGAAVMLCGLLVPASASAITLGHAEAIALRILRPARSHAVVYRWNSVLSARSVINEPGPGPLQSGKTGTPSDHIDGGSPGSCSFTVNDPYDLHRFRYEAIAFFLKCPPPGNYVGLRQGELIDCPGVTEG